MQMQSKAIKCCLKIYCNWIYEFFLKWAMTISFFFFFALDSTHLNSSSNHGDGQHSNCCHIFFIFYKDQLREELLCLIEQYISLCLFSCPQAAKIGTPERPA